MKTAGWSGIILMAAATAFGGDWMQWRGPELNGTCKAKNLPASFDVSTGKNVAWTCDLPGTGQSTPIIAGERIFLTASDNHRLKAICIDRPSGRIAWQKDMGRGREALRRGNMAHPSAVTDGETVCFLFGQGTVAGFAVDGSPLWKRELEEERGLLATKFGFSSSPLLQGGVLYIPLLYRADPKNESSNPSSTLLAVDLKSGKTLWEADRPTPATKESLDSYITPVIGKQGIILTGADLITCQHPKNGKLLWSFDVAEGNRKTNWRIISGPVMADDLAVSAYPRGRTLVAIKPDGKKAWDYKGYVPDVCTPAYDQGLLYVLDGKKRYLTCIEARSGKELWQEKIDSDKGFYASPLVADGKIHLINLAGEVFVYAAGKNAKLLERFAVGGENCSASIAAVGNSLFVRTPDKVICVRKQQ
jgi:outer membrane protein assembly factor BamB